MSTNEKAETSNRNYLREWISVGTLIFLIGVFAQQIRWQERTDSRIESLESHSNDKILHMPFEKSIKVFVPRVELDGRMNNLQYSLDKIDKKIDDLKR
jgi:hypothetical protein